MLRSKGFSACDHNESARPSQKYQRLCAVFQSDGVLRAPTPAATATSLPSVQLFAGSWHVAQENFPSAERRVSVNRALPNAIACGLPSARLVVSRGARSNGDRERMS